MPGIDARAPERTDSSSGSAAIAECLVHLLFDERDSLQYFVFDQRQRAFLALFGEYGAGLGADREAGGDGDAQAAHLRQIGTLAAEQVLHRRPPVGARRAEQVYVFDRCGHAPLLLVGIEAVGLHVHARPVQTARTCAKSISSALPLQIQAGRCQGCRWT
jgi:hypothetical protein